jgi:hypothetical protein
MLGLSYICAGVAKPAFDIVASADDGAQKKQVRRGPVLLDAGGGRAGETWG